MVDEAVRQRIRYLIEHGGVIPQEPPASRRLVCAVSLLIVALELVDIALELF